MLASNGAGGERGRIDESAVVRWRAFVSELKNLESMNIGGEWSKKFEPCMRCFEGIHWPQLRELELKTLFVEPKQLKTMLLTHRESLRELTLSKVCLGRGGDWDKLTREFGLALMLEWVMVEQFAREDEVQDGRGRPRYIHEERLKGLAKNLMGKQPCEIETVGGGDDDLTVYAFQPDA